MELPDHGNFAEITCSDCGAKAFYRPEMTLDEFKNTEKLTKNIKAHFEKVGWDCSTGNEKCPEDKDK